MANPVKERQWKDLRQKSILQSVKPGKEKQFYYPTLYLDSDQIGNAALDITNEITLLIKAEVVSLSKDSKGKISYLFDLKKLKLVP
jgi:hypothetical protein